MASRVDVNPDIAPQVVDDLKNVKLKVPPLVENLYNNVKVEATPSIENPPKSSAGDTLSNTHSFIV
ncbi:hypothetical protein MTR_8g105920 [Medicago truncatula]|uniref:Uncharacterized protein n=1 Tax=Medicago truncatula TaxID=3880 RepID=G7LBI0_MEDTR|nr:hypothetical protein MTR_8g105920 [Medicago truncatula]